MEFDEILTIDELLILEEIEELLPNDCLRINFEKDTEDSNKRIISFYSNSSKFDALIKEVIA